MTTLFALIPIVLPIFGLIGVGFLARIGKLIGDRTGDGLSDYVFSIAVPCLIFKTLNATGIPSDQPCGYWFAYFGGTAIVWTITMALGRSLFSLQASENVVAGFTSAQSNTVLVGVPLILQAYGDEGAILVASFQGRENARGNTRSFRQFSYACQVRTCHYSWATVAPASSKTAPLGMRSTPPSVGAPSAGVPGSTAESLAPASSVSSSHSPS